MTFRRLSTRVPFNEDGHGLPDPDVDWADYVAECLRRERRALMRFAANDLRIHYLDERWTEETGDYRLAYLEMGRDPEVAPRASSRENARQRARTYAQAILAEKAAYDMLNSGIIVPRQRADSA